MGFIGDWHGDRERMRDVLLAAEVHLHGADPAADGPAEGGRPGEHPSSGPAILAGNHLAVVDSFFLPLVCPRRVTFLAKSEYFTEPGFKGWLKKVFFGGSGQVPIDRTSADAAENALSTAKRLLGEEAVGHLPGGHALARRSSVQGQDRAGAYGAGNRGAGHSRRHGRHQCHEPAGDRALALSRSP